MICLENLNQLLFCDDTISVLIEHGKGKFQALVLASTGVILKSDHELSNIGEDDFPYGEEALWVATYEDAFPFEEEVLWVSSDVLCFGVRVLFFYRWRFLSGNGNKESKKENELVFMEERSKGEDEREEKKFVLV